MAFVIGQTVQVAKPMYNVFPLAQIAADRFSLTKFITGGGLQYAYENSITGTVAALPDTFDTPEGDITVMAIDTGEQQIIVEASAVSAITVN